METALSHKQRHILEKVTKIEEAASYRRRCLNVLVCPKCGGNLDYMLCSTEYLGAHFYLDVICPNGHKWRITWQKWLIGRRCKT